MEKISGFKTRTIHIKSMMCTCAKLLLKEKFEELDGGNVLGRKTFPKFQTLEKLLSAFLLTKAIVFSVCSVSINLGNLILLN